MPILLDSQTTDGDGTTIDWTGNHEGTIQVSGTWDGATVTVYGSLDDGTTWASPTNGTFTADKIVEFQMGTGKVKATITSAGASTDLSAWVSPG